MSRCPRCRLPWPPESSLRRFHDEWHNCQVAIDMERIRIKRHAYKRKCPIAIVDEASLGAAKDWLLEHGYLSHELPDASTTEE